MCDYLTNCCSFACISGNVCKKEVVKKSYESTKIALCRGMSVTVCGGDAKKKTNHELEEVLRKFFRALINLSTSR